MHLCSREQPLTTASDWHELKALALCTKRRYGRDRNERAMSRKMDLEAGPMVSEYKFGVTHFDFDERRVE